MSKSTGSTVAAIALVSVIAAVLGLSGWFISEQNKAKIESEKDPEKILGYTIGEVNRKYCGKTGVSSKFYISNRTFECSDLDDDFISSDLDNYILSSYSLSTYLKSFHFDIDKTQKDLRPLEVDNPEQFVGQMATALCPRYSLANFQVYVAGEHMSTSAAPCKDINQYSMYQDVIITNMYYGADEKSGDNPGEYYEQNNTSGTRKLYFDGEYIKDRISN